MAETNITEEILKDKKGGDRINERESARIQQNHVDGLKGSIDGLKDSIQKLETAYKNASTETDKLSKKMVWFTGALVVAAAIQAYAAWKQASNIGASPRTTDQPPQIQLPTAEPNPTTISNPPTPNNKPQTAPIPQSTPQPK